MSTEQFYIVLVVFLAGLLAFAYGEKVNHEQISTAMGLVTLVAIPAMLLLTLIFTLT